MESKVLYPAAKVVLIDPLQLDKMLLIYREINDTAGYEAAGGRVKMVDYCIVLAGHLVNVKFR